MIINSLSRPGKYHESENICNQDFVFSDEDEKFCVITLADGVSSCSKAREGAEIACKALAELFMIRGSFFFDSDIRKYRRDISKIIISYILAELEKISGSNNINEYSSTISAVLYDKRNDKILCFNLGDGMIAAYKSSKFELLVSPYQNNNGSCVTTTANAEIVSELEIFEAGKIKDVIIFSDGAWKNIFTGKNITFMKNGILFRELDSYLEGSECIDDYSYIAITKGGYSKCL